jgi:hypothetical protein
MPGFWAVDLIFLFSKTGAVSTKIVEKANTANAAIKDSLTPELDAVYGNLSRAYANVWLFGVFLSLFLFLLSPTHIHQNNHHQPPWLYRRAPSRLRLRQRQT